MAPFIIIICWNLSKSVKNNDGVKPPKDAIMNRNSNLVFELEAKT